MPEPSPGITFRETMKGGFTRGVTDPEEGARRGRESSTELAMHATIIIDDLDAFIADPEHGGHITGTIDFLPLGTGIPAHDGVFQLFSPTDDPDTRHMVYELAFTIDDQHYYLAGHKIVRKDTHFDLWSDTTTLYATLHHGTDKHGPIIAAGILGLSPVALMKLLTTVRAINAPTAAAGAKVIARFGEFFSGKLADAYLRMPVTTPHSSSSSPAAPVPPDPVSPPPGSGRTASEHWDVVIVGSGFGGAIMACRLAQAGQRVLVLERGRRWDHNHLPRSAHDSRWWWDARQPEVANGWLDLRLFDKVGVAQGAAVGGGSHIYANISVEAPPVAFADGWPSGVDYTTLKPYYDRVADFMDVAPVPANQWPERTRLMQEAAIAVGARDRFRQVDLAVSFDPDMIWDGRTVIDKNRSSTFINRHGIEQGTCYHCGMCDIGCDVNAKNTLDLNYLAVAEQHGCEIRPLHLVSHVEARDKGYAVYVDHLQHGQRHASVVHAERVILSAGSLGSTELLLRSRDVYRSLRKLSPALGRRWHTNGDFLTPAFYSDREPHPSRGPTITSAIDFLDGSRNGHRYWIQDGGVPDLLDAWLQRYTERPPRHALDGMTQAWVRTQIQKQAPLKNMMPWFAQGMDQPGGRFRLRPRWGLFGPRDLHIDWDAGPSAALINEIVKTHTTLSTATGGVAMPPASWTMARYLLTPHPLGGCVMSDNPELGVVDRKGEVFGHPRLYVIDGAMIPAALGVNPSRTIASLAEFCAEQILAGP